MQRNENYAIMCHSKPLKYVKTTISQMWANDKHIESVAIEGMLS